MNQPRLLATRLMSRAKPVVEWWFSELRPIFEPVLRHIAEEMAVSVLNVHEERTELRRFSAGSEKQTDTIVLPPLNQLSDAQREALRRATNDTEVRVCLSPHDVLVSTVAHTTAIVATRESLKYRLLQDSPIDVNRLVFAWRRCVETPKPVGDMQFFDVAMYRREAFDGLIAHIRSLGISPAAIGFGTSGSAQLDFVFPTDGRLGTARSLKRHRNKLLLAGLIVIPMIVMAAIGAYSMASVHAARQQLAFLAGQSRDADTLLRNQATLTAIHAELTRVSALPSSTQILDDLSESIPHDTWLTEFRLDDSLLRMTGQSADPARAAKTLALLPTLRDIRLTSVSSPTTGTVDAQFEITATVGAKP